MHGPRRGGNAGDRCTMQGLPPFTAPFAPLRLNGADEQVLRQATKAFLTEGVRDFEVFTKEYPTQRLPKDRWKLLRERKDVRVYMMRNSADTGLNAQIDQEGGALTTLVTVGNVIGSVADCLYGASAPTVEHVRIKSACLADSISNAAILHVMDAPTPEHPYRSMNVRWYAHKLPFPMSHFARQRDATFIEATGMTKFSTGERIGYHLLHSLHLPEFKPIKEYHRFEYSCITLWRKYSDQRSEIFMKTFADLKDSPVTMPLSVRALASSVLTVAEYAEAGRLKKLLWLFCRKATESQRTFPGIGAHSRPSKICTSCGKRLATSTPTTCALCGLAICVPCRVTRKLYAISKKDQMCCLRTRLCRPCWHIALSSDAIKIASEEVQSIQDAAWNESSSPLWPKVNESMWSSDSACSTRILL